MILRTVLGLVAALLCAAAIAALVVFSGYDEQGVTLVVGSLGLRAIEAVVTVIAGALGLTAAALLLYPLARRGTAGFVGYGVILLAVGLWGLVAFAAAGFVEQSSQYYSFSSPDGTRTVVVEERSFLLIGSLIVYAHEGDGIRYERIGSVGVDDGARPLTKGTYRITWLDDAVRLEFEDDNGWHTQEIAD